MHAGQQYGADARFGVRRCNTTADCVPPCICDGYFCNCHVQQEPVNIGQKIMDNRHS